MKAESTFLSTALSSFLFYVFYDEILNQEPREKGNCSKTTNPSSIREYIKILKTLAEILTGRFKP
jgi:hypothetical protein